VGSYTSGKITPEVSKIKEKEFKYGIRTKKPKEYGEELTLEVYETTLARL
jgi:hypothetical protein